MWWWYLFCLIARQIPSRHNANSNDIWDQHFTIKYQTYPPPTRFVWIPPEIVICLFLLLWWPSSTLSSSSSSTANRSPVDSSFYLSSWNEYSGSSSTSTGNTWIRGLIWGNRSLPPSSSSNIKSCRRSGISESASGSVEADHTRKNKNKQWRR